MWPPVLSPSKLVIYIYIYTKTFIYIYFFLLTKLITLALTERLVLEKGKHRF